MSGPLAGVKVLELAGIGPAPFCGMLLADMGADVLRIDRLAAADLGIPIEPRFDFLLRGRRSAGIDLKEAVGRVLALRLVANADALIEGFRPGVMERLGLGPTDCLAVNPRLVYGRVTGWGQGGPLAGAAGHDINYIALSGALGAIGEGDGPPIPPLNVIGDFGGGGAYLAIGVLAALLEARSSGKGQVVDAAMVDGAASLMTHVFAQRAAGLWSSARGTNILDGGAPWYSVYETSDGKHVAIGAIEQRFYAELLRRLAISDHAVADQHDRTKWPALRRRLADTFKTKTRDEWSRELEGTDTCFAPVLGLDEAPEHRHNKERGTFVTVAGTRQPAPAPRFGRTASRAGDQPAKSAPDASAVLRDWGVPAPDIAAARRAKAIA